MSVLGSIAEEALLGEDPKTQFDAAPEVGQTPEPVAPEPQGPTLFERLWAYLSKRTGKGAITEYMDHPYNVTHTDWNAYYARAGVGLIGDLNSVGFDLLAGTALLLWDRFKPAPPPTEADIAPNTVVHVR